MEFKQFKQTKTNECEYSVLVSSAEFKNAIAIAYEKIKKDVSVKGFRKGQVPQNVYEKHNSVQSLFPDALDILINDCFEQAINSKKAEIVSEPVDMKLDPEKLDVEKDFKLTLVIPTKPEVKLGQYKELEVKDVELSDTKGRVDMQLSQLQEKNKIVQPKDGLVEDGDIAVIDFEGFKDGKPFEGGKAENHELKIGSKSFIPGFEDQVIGMKSGDEKDINVSFPEEYHEKSLAGKPVVFKIKLHEVKQEKLPELNDDLAKASEYEVDTLDQLKEKLQEEVDKQAEMERKNKLIEQLVKLVTKNSTVELHEAMIKREMKFQEENLSNQLKQYQMDLKTYLQMTGMKEEDHQKQLHDAAVVRLSEILTLEQITKVEKFEVSKEQVEEKLQSLANQYKISLNEIKKYISEAQIEQEIKIQKAIDLLFETAKIVK